MSWQMAEYLGYKPLTTLWEDFSIAESFGTAAIKDTASRAFNAWKDNYKYLTELIMVINHKCWYWNDKGNDKLSQFYVDLYYEYDARVIKLLENDKEAITYYFRTLD